MQKARPDPNHVYSLIVKWVFMGFVKHVKIWFSSIKISENKFVNLEKLFEKVIESNDEDIVNDFFLNLS
jgi:hypothetical protein